MRGCEKVTRLLMDIGARLDVKNSRGKTALQVAPPGTLTQCMLSAEPARRAVLALWGVYRLRRSALGMFPRDVMRLVCRAVWDTRFDEEWISM
jgi:hypothetical protein